MRIVGIDLGTTNSLVGIIDKGRPVLFKGKDGSTLIPSVVRYPISGSPLVGAAAKQGQLEHFKETIYSAKRFLGRSKKDSPYRLFPFDFSPSDDQTVRFQVGRKTITPVEVSSHVLGELKRLAEASLGEPVKKAVVTVPAYFDDGQRQATKFAGELAGLEIVRIVNEPTAACLAYGLDKKAKGKIAVFDFGGGTFDISILRVQDGVFEVLATSGDTALGGDDLDHAIAVALAPEIEKATGKNPLSDNRAKAELVLKAEALKTALSELESVEFSFAEGTFRRTVKRTELEGWIKPVLDRLSIPSLACLLDSGLEKKSITDVILVGGSTRVPAVRTLVKELFGRDPISSINPDEVVAMGASVQANILSGQSGEMLLLDVIPLSLGIETIGGVTSRIIHRNSTIPVSASETFSTYVDGQVSVDIHVLQGERELVKDNRSLARFQLRGLPPLPAGIPKIEVEFIVDANGILSVRALEVRTGTSAGVEVNPSYGLNDTEVERMLSESIDNAETDFEARFLAETRVEAESIDRATVKSLERGGHLISDDQRKAIETALQDLRRSLGATDHKLIRAKLDRLNETSHSLAENLLNAAVRNVLKDQQIGGPGEKP